jgi:hypothetical protein
MSAPAAVPDVAEKLSDVADRYRHGHDRPIGGYGVLDATYGALVVGIGIAARRKRRLPHLRGGDIALIGVATHRLARTLAKDPVTSPFRMPFTRYKGVSGPAELKEDVVSEEGMAHAVGELVTCPFCLAQWVATGFVAGMIFAPRATRLVAATMAGVAVADFLQFAYAGAEQATSK